jgi:hypothetical protein
MHTSQLGNLKLQCQGEKRKEKSNKSKEEKGYGMVQEEMRPKCGSAVTAAVPHPWRSRTRPSSTAHYAHVAWVLVNRGSLHVAGPTFGSRSGRPNSDSARGGRRGGAGYCRGLLSGGSQGVVRALCSPLPTITLQFYDARKCGHGRALRRCPRTKGLAVLALLEPPNTQEVTVGIRTESVRVESVDRRFFSPQAPPVLTKPDGVPQATVKAQQQTLPWASPP